jgi:preprotein translocase subunit SecY
MIGGGSGVIGPGPVDGAGQEAKTMQNVKRPLIKIVEKRFLFILRLLVICRVISIQITLYKIPATYAAELVLNP